jgi:release factor glutamine methyltransferase
VTLALEAKFQVFATDISNAALHVAAQNSRKLGAVVQFVACDLGSGLAGDTFDLVVCNPPYIPETDSATIQREVRDHEPAVALYGGVDGFEIYRRLIPEAARLLKPGGWLVMELAYNAADRVRGLLDGWENVQVVCDLAGLPRVVVAKYVG